MGDGRLSVGAGARRAWRRALRCGVAASLLGLVAACGRGPDGLPAVRVGLAQAPANLDPRYATDAVSARVVRLLYGALVGIDEHGRPVPALADWVRETPDRYVFTLREGIAPFADGTPLTAADVAATYAAVLDPAGGSPHRGALAAIARVEALDARRVAFDLHRPDALLPSFLTVGILPAAALAAGHDFAARPLGSGPFRFAAREGEGRLRLERRRDGLAIELLEVRDPTVRALKLRRGEIDLVQNDLPPEIAAWLGAQPGLRLESAPGTTFAYLGLHLEHAALADPRVREAIVLAIDRRAVTEKLYAGLAEPAESMLPPQHWAGADLPERQRDPERARALLAQAGYGPGRPLRLDYKTSADPFRLRLAAVLQHQLREAGVEVAVRSYDWGTFYGDVKAGQFEIYSLAWVGVHTPDIFRYAFHSAALPPDGANRGRYRSAEVDRLVEAAERAQAPDEQAALFRAVQGRLHTDVAYVPLWREHNVAVTGARIAGYRLARDGNYDALADVLQRPGAAATP
ncbi:MAG: ABC transporter substrate-binding protein [Gammaproteobacteria bacterium]|jgi:peptide/nickel transport system substrate-binding protein|nr:ABC transporter substrate-binding protein [Gammaproteobacteria bacterium]